MGNNKRYAFICAYNGSNYHGCQLNNSVKTIEGTLLEVLFDLGYLSLPISISNDENIEEQKEINDEPSEEISLDEDNPIIKSVTDEENVFKKYRPSRIGLQRSSRTDKGVHSSFNTFIVKSSTNLVLKKDEIQDKLPADIFIYKVMRVTKGFHAHRRCESRIYHYYVKKTFFTYKRNEVNIKEPLNKAIKYYLGCNDYFNFTSYKNKKDTKRFIRRIELIEESDYFMIEIEGNSFLYNQIRMMVGYLIQIIRDALLISDKEEEIIKYLENNFKKCFTEKMNILKVPGEYLLLYYQLFKNYNEVHSSLHGKIEVEINLLNEVTDKLIKSKMFTKENEDLFLIVIDKFDESLNK